MYLRHHSYAGLLFLTFVVLACFLPKPALAAPDYIRHYKAGLEALEDQSWSTAEAAMERAIDMRPEEKKRLTWRPRKGYFPYYYLGLARYHAGNCPGALAAWETSEAHAAIVDRDLYDDLKRFRNDCRENGRPVAGQGSMTSLKTAKEATTGKEKVRTAQSWVEKGAKPTDRFLGVVEKVAPENSKLGRLASQGRGVVAIADEATELVDLVMAPPEGLSAAVDAYFAGNPSRALALLDSVDTDDSRAKAQVHLFRSAAHFRLYKETSEKKYLKSARASADRFQWDQWRKDFPTDFFDPRFVRFLRGSDR